MRAHISIRRESGCRGRYANITSVIGKPATGIKGSGCAGKTGMVPLRRVAG